MKKLLLLLVPFALCTLSCGGTPSVSSALLDQSAVSLGESSPEVVSDPVSSVSSKEDSSEESKEVSGPHSYEESLSELSSEESSISEEGLSSLDSASSEESSYVPQVDNSLLFGGYYSSLTSWTDGEDLKSKLHEIISGGTYTPIPYSNPTNWDLNRVADQDLYDHETLDVVYSATNVDKAATNSKWQREHAFCATLMTGSLTSSAVNHLGRATDFHNLFASSSSANSSRGNKNFGEANRNDPEYQDRTSGSGFDGYSFDPSVFEPGDKDKGRLSRAIFYMATMYSEEDYDEKNNVLMQPLEIVEEDVSYVPKDDCAFAIGHLSTLLKWSEFDVDLLEYQHNEAVYSYAPKVHSNPADDVPQGNRNPYVDFPELVSYAFGDKKDEPGTLSSLISSYTSLDIEGEGLSHYAVKKAKRNYSPEEPFSKDDIEVVSVAKNLEEEPFGEFSVIGAEEGLPFAAKGTYTIEIRTELNSVFYDVNVFTDYIESSLWKHKVTAKSSGNDFYGIADKNGVVHTLDFDDVLFDVKFDEGAVIKTSSTIGCQFGTSTAPVKKLTFTTHDEFSFNGLVNVNWLYLRGAPASGQAYDVSFFVGGQLLATRTLSYAGYNETSDVGIMLNQPKQGKVSIVISNITSAVYVQYLAINAI